MKYTSFTIAALFFISLNGYSQKSQMKIAQNAVGKLQAAIAGKQDLSKQKIVIGEGIKATENAQKDRKTQNWPETWAIKSYLTSFMAIIDDNEANSNRYYGLAIEALDTAKKLDRFQNNDALLEAANYNIILKKQINGNNAFQKNEYQTAYNNLKEVSDFFPTDTTLAINTALSAQKTQDFTNALAFFKRAKENGARNPILFQAIAGIHLAKFENDLAIHTLEEGMIANPGHVYLNNDYINLLIDNGKFDKAIKAIDKTLTVDTRNKLLYFLYGYLYQLQDKNSTAELAYRKALALDQNYFDALYQLGLAYIDMANGTLKSNDAVSRLTQFTAYINRAELSLLQAYEINPNDRATVHLLTEIYSRKNRFDKVQELKRKLKEF